MSIHPAPAQSISLRTREDCTATILPCSQTVDIDLAERSYPIMIGAGLLGAPATYAALPAAAVALVVTNVTVAPLYADALRAALTHKYAQVHLVALPDGRTQELANSEPDFRCPAATWWRPQDRVVCAGRRGGG